jgi:cytochrome c biogenesis protein CcmG, thiol:disulfide interchange protein DsbE
VRKKGFLVASVLLFISAMAVSGCIRRSSQNETLEIGRPAPAFKLPDLNGRQVSLDQLKGKVVLIDFWATWCGPCRMSMPLLENLQKEYPDALVLLAINLQESRDEVQDFVRLQNLHSVVLLDQQGDVGSLYGAEGIPMQVLIDKTGIVRYITGFNSSMAKRLRAEIEKLR